MKVDWLELINIIFISQLLIFTIFLWGKKTHHVSNYIFGAHLFSQAAGLFYGFGILQHHFFYVDNPHLSFIGYPFAFLWGPTFYFYVKSIAYKDFKLKWKRLIDIAPFLLILLYFSFTFYFYSAAAKRVILNDPSYLFFSYHYYIDMMLRLQIIFYIIKSYQILFAVRKEIGENYSSISGMNLSWLNFVIIGYSVCFLISISFIYTEFYLKNFSRYLYLGNFMQFFIYFNIIFFKAWNHPEIFRRIPEEKKYKHSRLTKNEAEYWVNKLSEHFAANKPFLNPQYTLNQLAKDIDVQPKILSQVINENFNQNFFDYINHFRIEEAKRMLRDLSNAQNVLQILYESGFDSKATFNRAFKKETGLTPTGYRKKFAGKAKY
jgi:AraC-like DNA-binding protein